MKTIHSLFLAFSIFFFSLSSYAINPLPEVAAPKWELKEQRVCVNWTASSDQVDVIYIVEKSRDGKIFSSEMVVMGGFEANNQLEFSCRFKYEAGTQYRIKQINNNGNYKIIDTKTF
jgi:hypothetical protein